MLVIQLQTEQIQALKLGDAKRLSVLRYILAQIKNKEIEKKAVPSDEEVMAILRKIAKELKESIDAFEKAERAELVEKNKYELGVVMSYLPAQISDEELEVEIKKVVEENKELYAKNAKAIIGIAIKKLKDKADPGRIMATLQKL